MFSFLEKNSLSLIINEKINDFVSIIKFVLNTPKNISIILKNGLYIPIIHVGLYLLSKDIFLSSIIALKLYTQNYYFWFGSSYKYFNNKRYNFIKQYIYFTHTGHFISFVYYFYPKILPIAFNIHFVISFGYWIGKIFFNLNDTDGLVNENLLNWFVDVWSYSIHIFPLCMFFSKIIDNKDKNIFTLNTLMYSYIFLSSWFIFIYIPWYYFTGDCVYSVFSKESSIKNISIFISIIIILFMISNTLGYLINNI